MSKMFLKRLGKIIKNKRIEKDYSQEILAEKVNMSRNAIGSIERAESNPTILSLNKILKALDIDLLSKLES